MTLALLGLFLIPSARRREIVALAERSDDALFGDAAESERLERELYQAASAAAAKREEIDDAPALGALGALHTVLRARTSQPPARRWLSATERREVGRALARVIDELTLDGVIREAKREMSRRDRPRAAAVLDRIVAAERKLLLDEDPGLAFFSATSTAPGAVKPAPLEPEDPAAIADSRRRLAELERKGLRRREREWAFDEEPDRRYGLFELTADAIASIQRTIGEARRLRDRGKHRAADDLVDKALCEAEANAVAATFLHKGGEIRALVTLFEIVKKGSWALAPREPSALGDAVRRRKGRDGRALVEAIVARNPGLPTEMARHALAAFETRLDAAIEANHGLVFAPP